MERSFEKVKQVVYDSGELFGRISGAEARVGIIGMGYVGLPLTVATTAKNFRVLGFDIDIPKVEGLNRGKSPLKHIPDHLVASAREAGLFEATGDMRRLHEVDIVIVCVPTPLGPHREPDLTYVVETTRHIAQNLRRGQLVVLESTSFPGTTREVMRPILESGGLKSGQDFFLAFSPEREDPGNTKFTTAQIPKVVGGDGDLARGLASAFYGAVVERVVEVSSTDAAEAVKITENIFRAVNIALVNELKIIYSKMGINIFEVIEAAKTKPFGFMAFYPGPGLGGHCIPIDPFYLTWKAREFDANSKFIELAGEVNSEMPRYVVDRVAAVIDEHYGIGLSQAKILIVGIAYKKDVDDMRESPALVIVSLLQARRAKVDYHDPFIPVVPKLRAHPGLAGMRSVSFDAQTIAAYDAALIVTDHSGLDWQLLADSARVIVDTRNAIAKVAHKPDKAFIA
jgi:UDP-N-acetyl-D-glucosamine dehydrogenase